MSKALPTTLAGRATIARILAEGEEVTKDSRLELLRQSLAGEPVMLEVDAEVFVQPDKPLPLPADQAELANHNFVRFAEGELEALAGSFEGRPFLRDHDQGSMEAKAGRILSSRLEQEDGVSRFLQQLAVVKPWAVQGVLDGTIEHFSIGWDPAEGGFRGLARSVPS